MTCNLTSHPISPPLSPHKLAHALSSPRHINESKTKEEKSILSTKSQESTRYKNRRTQFSDPFMEDDTIPCNLRSSLSSLPLLETNEAHEPSKEVPVEAQSISSRTTLEHDGTSGNENDSKCSSSTSHKASRGASECKREDAALHEGVQLQGDAIMDLTKGEPSGSDGSFQLGDCGRERLKRHRVEVAGRVWIPDTWGQEDLLKDWIDCSAFDASLVSNKIMSARSALVEGGRRANSSCLRMENRC